MTTEEFAREMQVIEEKGKVSEEQNLINDIISKSKESFVINEEIAKFISDTDSPQGIFCICEKPSTKNTNENFKNNINYNMG